MNYASVTESVIARKVFVLGFFGVFCFVLFCFGLLCFALLFFFFPRDPYLSEARILDYCRKGCRNETVGRGDGFIRKGLSVKQRFEHMG